MKKINKIIGIMFLFSFIFYFSPFFVGASTTVWYYTANNSLKTRYGPFETDELCKISLADYEKSPLSVVPPPLAKTNGCQASSIAGQPIPPGNPVSVTPTNNPSTNSDVYNLLAPIGGMNTAPNDMGDYFNKIFLIAIGLCGALAVVMLIIGGIQYMGEDSVFGKTKAKEQITSAVFGLLIALGAYALLNTINPELLGKSGINIKSVSVAITDFTVSGPATFDGKPIQINFKKDAYPAAKVASQKTGVDTAFILAMFAQETGSGSNTGKCTSSTANMGDGQLASLQTVVTNLNTAYPNLKLDYQKINMSCSGAVANDHGGAIGYTQFLPGTWLQYSGAAKTALGHEPNPWNTADALMMTALFLKGNGGAGSNLANQEAAACHYFGACTATISCGSGKTGTYGQCIMGKKLSIQEQITAAIKNGEIS